VLCALASCMDAPHFCSVMFDYFLVPRIAALEGNGFRIMLLLRLSPLIPYNALDYISGVTSISVAHYCLALIGLLPGAMTLCYIGATASSLADGTKATENSKLRTVVLILGVFFAVAGGALASYYSKIELDKILNGEDEEITPTSLLAENATQMTATAIHDSEALYSDSVPGGQRSDDDELI
jgi:SNARE associated Golgi protein